MTTYQAKKVLKGAKNAGDSTLVKLMDHYVKGTTDVTTRRTRKNGWNEVINAYMSKLPANWPYTAMVTDPRIRRTILEKTARLLNSKLQGRLIPREGGDMIKAKINNAILDFQWDNATEGGPMVEKIAMSDQISRLYGAAFVYVYWDSKKNTNEIKICDPNDIFIDFSATHIRNAKWVQYREFTSIKQLEKRGYDVSELKAMVENGISDYRDSLYEDQVKLNRGLEDRVGRDLSNPVIELVTEWTGEKSTVFAPRYGLILKEGKNPYKHGELPFAQLRYYPLGDDIYGESEVESVIPLQRAINAILCGAIDEANIAMRPPLKLISGQYRKESIQYGPGAQWIMTQPNAVMEAQIGGNLVANFNTIYPALVAAFNTAMGDQSLGVSNVAGRGTEDKTATEVISLEKQQTTSDQYNQLYLAEFLKDIMMMWLSNNKQYLFDDPTKKFYIVKIIGKDNIQAFQQMQLDGKDIPDEAMNELVATMEANPEGLSDEALLDIANEVAIPTNPVITNPDENDPENYDIKQKLDVKDTGDEADLYVTPGDMDGVYDYIPDVKSMAAGAGQQQQQARQKAIEYALNPQVMAQLQTQGEVLDIKKLLVSSLEDAGFKDAEGLFTKPTLGPGIPGDPTGQVGGGLPLAPSMGAGGQAVPPGVEQPGIPPTQGFQGLQ